MQNINIGIQIDYLKLLVTRMLIQAGSGGGKSYTTRKVIESVGNQGQQIILDPEGEFVTLREKFDFVLIAKDGDIPLSLKYAETLAHKLLETGISAIIDLYELKAHERILFVKRFLEAMINSPKELWHPCLVYVDEAHIFCPQNGEAASQGAVIDLCTRGRKRGFAAILATQRLSKLHKDAAAECLNKMIGRTGLDIDRKRAGEELGFTDKKEILQIRDLEPGEFYAFGPAISNNITKFKVQPVITTHREPGQGLVSRPATPKAIQKILSKLSDIPEEAEKELITKQQLQAEVTRLRGEVTRLNKPSNGIKISAVDNTKLIAQAKLETTKEFQTILRDKDKYIKGVQDQCRGLSDTLAKIVKLAGGTASTLKIPEQKTYKQEVVRVVREAYTAPIQVAKAETVHSRDGGTPIGKCGREIIMFLAGHESRSFSKTQIGVAIGYSPISSGFQNALSDLNTRGFIIRGQKIQVNAEKIPAIENEVGQITPFHFDAETFKSKLGKCELEIYEVVLSRPEDFFSKETLANETASNYSPTSSGFQNSLSKLNTLELIVRQGGQIRLNPELLELL